MKISHDLTSAELRMLYLLITEPEIIEISQKEFGNKINAHRRTINIGLKKLKEYKLIRDIDFNKRGKNIADHQTYHGEKIVSMREETQAKKFIIDSFKKFYYPINKRHFIVNEDFYSLILGDFKLHENLRYKKEFITKTILEEYPKCLFHFKKDISTHVSDIDYNIIHHVNREIIKARKYNRYYINKAKLLTDVYNNYSIIEEDTIKGIKKFFPKLVIVKNRIRIHKPYKGIMSEH